MDVTDVLRDRRQEPDGLARMAAISFAAHGAVLAFLMFGPMHSLSSPVERPKSVMTISLGGAGDGPKSGGLTAIGGRPVQTTEPATVREAVRPPAAAAPEMVSPKTTAKATTVTKPAPSAPVVTPVSGTSFDVLHQHKFGKCRGRLIVSRSGVSFVPDKKGSDDAVTLKAGEYVQSLDEKVLTIRSAKREYRFTIAAGTPGNSAEAQLAKLADTLAHSRDK